MVEPIDLLYRIRVLVDQQLPFVFADYGSCFQLVSDYVSEVQSFG